MGLTRTGEDGGRLVGREEGVAGRSSKDQFSVGVSSLGVGEGSEGSAADGDAAGWWEEEDLRGEWAMRGGGEGDGVREREGEVGVGRGVVD